MWYLFCSFKNTHLCFGCSGSWLLLTSFPWLWWLLLWPCTGSRQAGSVVVAHGLSCSESCGIFLDQGSNWCPPHCKADPSPLGHQGSPRAILNVPCGSWWCVIVIKIYRWPAWAPTAVLRVRFSTSFLM